jgi:orotate phosphoribosyltransferase-like protein
MNVTAKHVVAAKKLRAKGLTYQTIANQLNMSLGTAYHAAKGTSVRTFTGIPNAKTPAKIEAQANALRAKGWIYADIESLLSIPTGTAWRLCNRERSREHARDSTARYVARGKVAIADIRPKRLWLAMNQNCV